MTIRYSLIFWFTALVLTAQPLYQVRAGTQQTIAVLPFAIHSDKNMDYTRQGILRMFFSRLSWPGKVRVIPPEKIQKAQTGLDEGLSENQRVKAVATRTDSQYVLSGAITRFDDSFSLDAKVFDIANKRYMAFSDQSETSDDLIQKVDRIAAAINQKVFERTTVTWEEMEQEKQKQINELKRQNPENLMPLPQNWQPEEKVGWKVWKYLF